VGDKFSFENSQQILQFREDQKEDEREEQYLNIIIIPLWALNEIRIIFSK
jgi:hypothetical protein